MGIMTPDLGTFLWMLIPFLIVLFLLKKFAWKPILGALKEREDSIEEALQSAEEAKKQMAALQADNERILQEARMEREAMLKEAKELGNKIVGEAKQKAIEEANKLIANAKQEIENEKNSAIGEIKAEIATLSVEIAEKVLRKEFADNSLQQEYVKGLVDEVKLN